MAHSGKLLWIQYIGNYSGRPSDITIPNQPTSVIENRIVYSTIIQPIAIWSFWFVGYYSRQISK